ncbi:Late promoter-activating protein [Escherichia coli]
MFSHPVYLFLRKFSLQDSRGGSKYSSVLIDDSTRPRRFQIHSLNPEFFRRSRAPRRFDEKLQNELYMTQDEKERREHQPWVMARQLFNKVVRQHRHYGNATSARI